MSIQEAFKAQFPNGYFETYTSPQTGTLYVTLGLVSNTKDVNHNIRENDPMHHVIRIQPNNGVYVAETITDGLSIDPLLPYLAMSHVNTKFRKTTGDMDKINKYLIKFFSRLRDLVNENAQNIYNRDMYAFYLK